MVYILVLFGSFFGICVILGLRIMLKNRRIRWCVRGVFQRTHTAQQKGLSMQETRVERPKKHPRASAIAMQKVRSFLREAEKANTRKNYHEAERLLIQAITLEPTSVEARAELARLYLITERCPKAEALYRELLHDAHDVTFHANLGLACYKQGKFEQSCDAYRTALQLDERNAERSAALGRACIAARRYTDAADLLERASERLARDVDLLQILAECYERLGDLESAKQTYMRIHRLKPYDETVKEKLVAMRAG